MMKACKKSPYSQSAKFEDRNIISLLQKDISRPVTFTKQIQLKKRKQLPVWTLAKFSF